MYSLTIRSHMMIAHSLPDSYFGLAQNLHGATYITDVTFCSKELDNRSVVIDIGYAHKILDETIGLLNYSNLDELPQFLGILTTTEFLARYIHDCLVEKLTPIFKGKILVTLGESPTAWACFEGDFIK